MTTDNTQELDELLAEAYQRGWKCAQAGYVSEDDKRHAVGEAKQAILDWHNKQVEEARVEGAQHIFNMLEANVMLVDDDEISGRKLMGNMYEHLRLYAERKRLKGGK